MVRSGAHGDNEKHEEGPGFYRTDPSLHTTNVIVTYEIVAPVFKPFIHGIGQGTCV